MRSDVTPYRVRKTGSSPRLNWGQFLAETRSYTAQTLDLAALKGLVERLDLDEALFEGRVQFCREAYARNLLYKDELFEAVCLCWEGPQRTSIHNHGRSFGVVVVWQGSMREEIFRYAGSLQEVHAHDVAPGQVAVAPVGMIHRLGNAGGDGARLVSLHFYAGPLDVMDVFDPQSGERVATPMRYLSDGDLPPTS